MKSKLTYCVKKRSSRPTKVGPYPYSPRHADCPRFGWRGNKCNLQTEINQLIKNIRQIKGARCTVPNRNEYTPGTMSSISSLFLTNVDYLHQTLIYHSFWYT